MSAIAATLIGPFRDARTYRQLAFLLSALPLAAIWLGLLLVLWTATLVISFTPLVVPALIAMGLAVRLAAAFKSSLARKLLGAKLCDGPVSADDAGLIGSGLADAPGLTLRAELAGSPRRGRSFWGRASAVLRDGSMWRAQAYLVLRMTVGFAVAIALVSFIAVAVYLIAAPTFYWSIPGGIGPDGYRVNTLPEALSLLPLGLLALLASARLIAPLAMPWRSLSRTLLDQDTTTRSQSHAKPKSRASLPAARRAVLIHAASVGGLNLLLIVIWALTSRGYFWPIWTLLVFALPLAIHAWVVVAQEREHFWIEHRLDTPLALHSGIWFAFLLFQTGIWAAAGGGYFWPVWELLLALIAVGAHASVVLLRPHDRAALTERISALESSRAGAVDVQEAELRRIERDLHDGAQARLVALGMSLGMAEQKLADDADPAAARELLAEARVGAGEALRELRGLARGIHPPVLADRGLEAAVRALAVVSPISVTVSVTLPSRPRPPVESAAYFVVAESLANAGKHAQASRVDVRVTRRDELLSVEIHDDGVGGADPSGGGLSGLRSRVQALDGTLSVVSPHGGPTTVRAELPCE